MLDPEVLPSDGFSKSGAEFNVKNPAALKLNFAASSPPSKLQVTALFAVKLYIEVRFSGIEIALVNPVLVPLPFGPVITAGSEITNSLVVISLKV